MLLRRSPVRGSGLYLAHKLLTFRSMLRLYRAGVGLTSFTFARFATRGFLGWDCSPLDIINYSTGAWDCQEGNFNFLKFFQLNPDGSDPPLSRFPLDTTHYSTFDGDCQEGILVFFFSLARFYLHLGHYLPLAQPTGSHPS